MYVQTVMINNSTEFIKTNNLKSLNTKQRPWHLPTKIRVSACYSHANMA